MHVDLTVATFNVRNGRAFDGLDSWPLRRRATARMLASLDADVVGLQEVYGFQRSYLLRHVHGYRSVGVGRRDGRRGEQCPILVRDPVQFGEHSTRWFSDRPDRPGSRLPGASFPRVATIARCRHEPSGLQFDVVNVHLDEHIADNRVRSIDLLSEWLDGSSPLVLLGDLNTTSDDEAVMGALADGGFSPVPFEGGTNHDFSGGTDGPRLDHVLTRDGAEARWEVRSSAIVTEHTGRRLPSDHWPAVACLRLSTGG